MKFTMPSWHEDARRLKNNGMTINQIVLIMGESGINVSRGRVAQVVSPNWERYTEITRAKFRAIKTEIDKAKREGRLPDTKTAVKAAMLSFRQKEIAMADRHFEQAFSGVTDRNGVRIRCSVKDCTNTMIFSRKGAISPVHAARWFRDKGWFVGHNDKFDLCEEHYHPKKQEPVPTEGPMKTQELSTSTAIPVTPDLEPIVIKTGAVTHQEENGAGREMTRMDKRTIHLKLEEVYVDEDVGYRKGWNDEAVAGNLGVPREWVALIREDSFGPETSILRKERLETMAQVVFAKAEAVKKTIVDIDRMVEMSNAQWDVLDKRLDEFDVQKEEFAAAVEEFTKERDQ